MGIREFFGGLIRRASIVGEPPNVEKKEPDIVQLEREIKNLTKEINEDLKKRKNYDETDTIERADLLCEQLNQEIKGKVVEESISFYSEMLGIVKSLKGRKLSQEQLDALSGIRDRVQIQEEENRKLFKD